MDLSGGATGNAGGRVWHVFAFEGFCGHPDDLVRLSPAFVRDDWLTAIDREFRDQAIHYHPCTATGVRRALAEAMQAGSDGGPDARRRLVVLGFSYGGHAAVQFAARLEQRGIAIDAAFTADPIPKGMAILSRRDDVFVRPGNVRRWKNVYQRADRGSLAGVVPLRGRRVRGADVDQEIDVGARGHLRITSDARVVDALCDLLDRVVQTQP